MADITLLSQSEKLRLEVEHQGNIITIRPVGTVDEDVNFGVVQKFLADVGTGADKIQFDLGSIKRLNSCGVREWLLFMERLASATKVPLEFVNVNELFVEQANQIPNTFGKRGAAVLSFQAPYSCPACNKSYTMLIKPAQIKYDAAGVAIPPAAKCPKCSGPMEFDSIREEYFGFLKAA